MQTVFTSNWRAAETDMIGRPRWADRRTSLAADRFFGFPVGRERPAPNADHRRLPVGRCNCERVRANSEFESHRRCLRSVSPLIKSNPGRPDKSRPELGEPRKAPALLGCLLIPFDACECKHRARRANCCYFFGAHSLNAAAGWPSNGRLKFI